MNPIERRDFLRGTATGVLAFTTGGAEIIMSTREAHAQNVPFRLLQANEAETIEALGETLVPGARAAGIAHFIDQQLSVPPEEALLEASISMFAHPMPDFIEVRLPPSTMRARRSTAAASSRSSVRGSSTISSTLCAKTKSKAGRAPADRSSTCCCVVTPWMWSTARWKATKPSASHTCLISRRTRGGDHGDE